MSYWEVIAPAVIVAMGGVVVLARRLRHPPGTRADRAHLRLAPLDLTPDVRAATVPVAEVAGDPPWAPAAAERGPGSLGTWFPHGPYPSEAALVAGLEAQGWFDPEMQDRLRRELHHVDAYDPDPFGTEQIEVWIRDGMQVNWVDDSPREDGAGDESEACGPPAPPAPLRPVDLALARCDLFMVAMRADHERWLASARERWAAA